MNAKEVFAVAEAGGDVSALVNKHLLNISSRHQPDWEEFKAIAESQGQHFDYYACTAMAGSLAIVRRLDWCRLRDGNADQALMKAVLLKKP